jgi:hypothetical protein
MKSLMSPILEHGNFMVVNIYYDTRVLKSISQAHVLGKDMWSELSASESAAA